MDVFRYSLVAASAGATLGAMKTEQNSPSDSNGASSLPEFLEELAIGLVGTGYSRMSARVIAAIICSDLPEGPTQADLATMLGASPAAISTASRSLITAGMIRKVSIPGERADRYQLNHLAKAELAMITDNHRSLAEIYASGTQLFDEDSPVRQRLQAIRDYHVNFANATSAFAQFWSKDHPIS